jgi:hypothetical protein
MLEDPRSSPRPTARSGSSISRSSSARSRRTWCGSIVSQSALARAGRLRDGARELRCMHIGEEDVAPLAAFLRSLNEDYE